MEYEMYQGKARYSSGVAIEELLLLAKGKHDHRRVLNQECFFTRQGWSVPITGAPHDYLPGDFVTCRVYGLPHIMIVSDRKARDGTPLIIHNIGGGTQEENALFSFQLTGHFRLPMLNPDSAPSSP